MSTETKVTHTPGPWITAPTGEVMRGYAQPLGICQRGEANLVAGVFGDVRGGIEVVAANARLIAAAPELLDRLREVLSLENEPCPYDANTTIAAARMLIARIDGETE